MLCELDTRVNDSFRPDSDGKSCKYPKGGHLVYPYAILKEFGPLARTISALWHMESPKMPRPAWNPAPLARNACMPVKTLKDQLPKLIDLGVVDVRKSGRLTEYRLTRTQHWALAAYADAGAKFTRIPRVWHHRWPGMTFSEMLLLGYYVFTSGQDTFAEERAISDRSHERLAEILGFSPDTWKRSQRSLVARGLIDRGRIDRREAYVIRLAEGSVGAKPVSEGAKPVTNRTFNRR